MSEIVLSSIELRALEAALTGDASDPVSLMRSAGIDVSSFFEYGDWRQVDFTNSDLSGVSFRGSDMREAILTTDQVSVVLATKPLYPPSSPGADYASGAKDENFLDGPDLIRERIANAVRQKSRRFRYVPTKSFYRSEDVV